MHKHFNSFKFNITIQQQQSQIILMWSVDCDVGYTTFVCNNLAISA